MKGEGGMFRKGSPYGENRITVQCSKDHLMSVLREGVAPNDRARALSDTPKPLIGEIQDDSFSVYSRSARGDKGAALKGSVLPIDEHCCEIIYRTESTSFQKGFAIVWCVPLLFAGICDRSFPALFMLAIGVLFFLFVVKSHTRRTSDYLDELIQKAGPVSRESPMEEKEHL